MRRQPLFQPFYCYIEKITGNKIITPQTTTQTEEMDFFYVAACPNERVARTVYDRHLDIARL